MTVTIGFDVGGTKVLGVVLDAAGRTVVEQRRPSPPGFEPLVDLMATLAAELTGIALGEGIAPATAIGVGVAGLVDRDGVLRYGPNLPGVVDAPIRDALAARTGMPVVVDNDANVAGLAEVRHGAAAGVGHALLVTLGTGIGGAIVADGQVFRGANGFAGEIGHQTVAPGGPLCACGERGHWEAIASGTALGRMGRELVATGGGSAILDLAGGNPEAVDGLHVGAAARADDPEALALLDRYADNVAIGLANLANVLDPQRVVVAGGLVALGDLLFDRLERAFGVHLEATEHRPRIPVVPAALGEQSGAIGAAVLARESLG